jgi:hypothetical protein
LRRFKPEFLTSLPHDTRIKLVLRPGQGNPSRAALAVGRYRNVTFVAYRMLVTIDAASLLDQPLPKCRALHDTSPSTTDYS